jgi:hypothetical protein
MQPALEWCRVVCLGDVCIPDQIPLPPAEIPSPRQAPKLIAGPTSHDGGPAIEHLTKSWKGESMPRVIVTTSKTKRPAIDTPVLLDERVDSIHLDDSHAAMQFVERVGWAISDAEDLERVSRRV